MRRLRLASPPILCDALIAQPGAASRRAAYIYCSMKQSPERVLDGGFATFDELQRRVLWLSTLMIHHANSVRPNPSGIKVGGHQASSASVVSLLTFLFFEFMRAGDRISVKPHASPVLHAIQYLLGNLDAKYLTMLRQHHGLQAYPSRTKDPDLVDFSTGSMGLGSVAPNYAALVDRYVSSHFGAGPARRYISLVGDGELDEGSIWESIAEPALADLDNVIWAVDVNRQSLDRVVPGIRIRQLEDMFRANGWDVFEAKYGRALENAFEESGGRLRVAIDEMTNEEYQFLLRAEPSVVRRALGTALPEGYADDELLPLIGSLGGHDPAVLRSVFSLADAAKRPAIVFAYTIKGWGLPIAGDPLNHQAQLTASQIAQLGRDLGIEPGGEWATFPAGTRAAELCGARSKELAGVAAPQSPGPQVPTDLGHGYQGTQSTQRAFGLMLTVIGREHEELARHVVTVSPDVAISTNLGGWINRVGVFDPDEKVDLFAQLGPRLVSWRRHPRGQHIELGISETNLMMALGQLGLANGMVGAPLLPIGTLYDPFVARGLEALIYGVYAGGRFVVVGTPSGIALASEGGAHQSIVTPPIGLAIPGLVYWEPCFAQELEWILLHALSKLHATDGGEASYLRLSTAPVDQRAFPSDADGRLRQDVLSGAYRLVSRGRVEGAARCEIWATGVAVIEALAASEMLLAEGIVSDVVNCTSPDLVFRSWQAEVRGEQDRGGLKRLGPPVGPAITVIDGHPSTLAWVGSMLGVPAWPLGVTRFGESATRQELFRDHQIDAAAIAETCRRAVRA